MKSRFAFLAVAWLALGGASHEPKGFAEIWTKYGQELTSENIPKPMAKQAYLWAELQYHLGRCRAYIPDNDMSFWRTWWDKTTLKESPYGLKILDAGVQNFNAGTEDAEAEPLSGKHCQNIFDSWTADMRSALDTRKNVN